MDRCGFLLISFETDISQERVGSVGFQWFIQWVLSQEVKQEPLTSEAAQKKGQKEWKKSEFEQRS